MLNVQGVRGYFRGTGGDQSLLRGSLRGTRMAEALQRLLARQGAVGGASAGASLLWSLDFKGSFGQTNVREVVKCYEMSMNCHEISWKAANLWTSNKMKWILSWQIFGEGIYATCIEKEDIRHNIKLFQAMHHVKMPKASLSSEDVKR